MKKIAGFFICIILILTSINVLGNINIKKISNADFIYIENSDVDWWSMYHHDLQLTGYTTSPGLDTNKVLWTKGTFDYFWFDPQRSSVAIVDDTIFLGVVDPSYPLKFHLNSNLRSEVYNLPLRDLLAYNSEPIEASSQERWYEAYVLSMNANNGVENWMTRLPDEFYISGSAAVAEGKVIITATEDIASPFGHLYCLNAFNGSIIWSFPLNEDWFVSPVVDNGRVYASGWILMENHSRMCRLYCLNADSGVEIFNASLGFGEPIDAAAIYNNCVYVSVWDEDAGKTFLYCVNAQDGSLCWCKNLLGNLLDSSPVIYNECVYVTSSFYDGYETVSCYVWCLDAITGGINWDKYIEGGINGWSIPAVANNKLFVSISNELNDTGWMFCLDALTGDNIWCNFLSDNGVLYSSPVVADGKLYINSLSYFTFRGNLYCLNTDTGNILWDYWLIYGSYSSPAIANGRLYLGIGGQFFAFDDNAPANMPPTVNISGPKSGHPGVLYDFNILPEDPEGSDLFTVIQWSPEYPEICEAGVHASGESYVIDKSFEEEGDYWIRVRVQDEQHAWSDWEQVNIKIQKNKAIYRSSLLIFLEQYPLLKMLFQLLKI